MASIEENIVRLKALAENVVGRTVQGPKDFDFLCRQIEGYTGERLSQSTLKRIWGYVASKSNISTYSLDVLSRMVGYANWNDFASASDDGDTSYRVVRRKLMVDALSPGDMVRLAWKPDRVVTARYEGQDLFVVISSINSKLQPDDTFRCLVIVEHEPLYLHGLYRKGMPPCDYICGKNGGVVWSLV